MINMNEKLLSSIINLEGNKDFLVFIEWLSDNLNDKEMINRIMKDEVMLRWGQGHIQILSEILDTVVNSRSLKNKF